MQHCEMLTLWALHAEKPHDSFESNARRVKKEEASHKNQKLLAASGMVAGEVIVTDINVRKLTKLFRPHLHVSVRTC